MVVTKTPLFTAADEAGAPPLRPGVWVMRDPDCTFDETRPMDSWPDCAGGMVYEGGMALGVSRKDGKLTWKRQPLVIAGGDPRIAQVRFQMNLSSGAGDVKSGQNTTLFGYAAVRPLKVGPGGKVIAFSYWPVQCGPPPPPPKPNAKPEVAFQLGTRHPLPGIEMKKGDALCTTSSVDALRGAAKASEAWREKEMTAHWARAPGPGDRPPPGAPVSEE
ncbi:hypothetical protein ACO2Q3_01675 [Caulobacter sp. KR2-114]|uniref:hypothetical protein n=1 Tax=Caulobacter sp. KR2-114 TaxID=3400912 RepID=UPI003C03375C